MDALSMFTFPHMLCALHLQGWFDALRLELVASNINVTMVCSGPVFTQIRKQAFTQHIGTVSFDYTEVFGLYLTGNSQHFLESNIIILKCPVKSSQLPDRKQFFQPNLQQCQVF